jgi:CheY-like chemotaxis protein
MVMIDRHRFDLIICDVDMPKVRGDDLVVAARACQPDAAILLFSGNPDNIHDEARGIVDRVLWKPSEPEFVLYCGQVLVHERRMAESPSVGAS